MDELKEFFIKLQNGLVEDRENECCQADPIYYGIYDFKGYPVSEGYEDKVELYDPDSCETASVKQYFENMDDSEKEDLCENTESGIAKDEDGSFYIKCESDFANYLIENKGVFPCYIADIGYVIPDCLFLTRKDAQEHLTKNFYHYTKDAKTYAMTAWRSPRYETLIRLLKSIDWEKSNLVLLGDNHGL